MSNEKETPKAKDVNEEQKKTEPIKGSKELPEYRPDEWKLISRKVVGDKTFITEAIMIAMKGVVERDIVISGDNVSICTIFIPGVRVGTVKDKAGMPIGFSLNGGNV
jgi:hypothetical protein